MSTNKQSGLAQVMQVFISSPSKEMEVYRRQAIRAIEQVGMIHKNYNDPKGADFTQGSGTIFDLNRRSIMSSDVFVGLYGFGPVWKPASEPELVKAHAELSKRPDKLIMEYEYEWAQEGGLYIFPFLRTDETADVPPLPIDSQIDQFRLRLRSRTVGWLTTPETFYKQLLEGLIGIAPRVFLSYSREDLEYVRDLQRQLREQDLHAWRDEVSIPGGTEWARVIDAAINEMDVMVVVVTSASAKSEWVEKECSAFLKNGKTVVPYVVHAAKKAALPTYLAPLQYVDGTCTNGPSVLARRLRAVLATMRSG
jgi:nucleotide-binding universal stress UspA family protein